MFVINVNPIAFAIGPFKIAWYGILIATGVMVLIWWTLRGVRQSGNKVPNDVVMNAALIGIPSGIILSRALHVVDQWGYYSQHLNELVGGQGLTIYGAVLGAALGIWIYSRVAKFNFGYLADIIAPGIILAQALGRVGCTLNGCCYGTETDAWCAIVYENPNSFGPIGIPVYPTQVFEIGALLVMFAILLPLRNRLRPDGSIFRIYMALYAAWRVGIGFLREGSQFAFGLEQAQVIGIIVLAIAIPILVKKTRWIKKPVPGEPPTEPLPQEEAK